MHSCAGACMDCMCAAKAYLACVRACVHSVCLTCLILRTLAERPAHAMVGSVADGESAARLCSSPPLPTPNPHSGPPPAGAVRSGQPAGLGSQLHAGQGSRRQGGSAHALRKPLAIGHADRCMPPGGAVLSTCMHRTLRCSSKTHTHTCGHPALYPPNVSCGQACSSAAHFPALRLMSPNHPRPSGCTSLCHLLIPQPRHAGKHARAYWLPSVRPTSLPAAHAVYTA